MGYPLTFEIESLHLFLDFGFRVIVAFIFKCINFFGREFDFNHCKPHSDWKLQSQIYQNSAKNKS